MLLEKIEYKGVSIEGDYAYLQKIDDPELEPKCVARALLPAEISEGCRVNYEMMSYSMA